MQIKTARRLLMFFMIVAVALALIGLIFLEPGTVISVYVTLISFGCMVAAMIILIGYCKCPWCGKRITANLMKAEYCPHCKKDFETGLKHRGRR